MQQIEFRLGQRQRVVYLAPAAVSLVLAMVRFAASAGSAFASLVVAGVFLFYYFWSSRFGLTLTTQGVTFHGWQTSTRPWQEIQSVEPTLFWFQRRTLFRFTDGTTRRAWAPVHDSAMPDPEFDAKVQGIRQWHAQFSGLPPAPGAFGVPAQPNAPFGQAPAPQPFAQPGQPYAQAPQPHRAPGPHHGQGPAPVYGQAPGHGQAPVPGQPVSPGPYQGQAPGQPGAAPQHDAHRPGPGQGGVPPQPTAPPQQTPGEWTQVFGAGGTDPDRPA